MSNQILLTACGVLNAAFVAFHLFLAQMIHRLPSLAPGYRALMQALNLGGVLLIAFLAFAYLACRKELGSRLGRATAILGATLYLTRAIEEHLMFPAKNPLIIAVCIVAGLLHLATLRVPRGAIAA